MMKGNFKNSDGLPNELVNSSSKNTRIPDSETKTNKISQEYSIPDDELKVQLFKTPDIPKKVDNDSDFDQDDKESLEAEIFERISLLYDTVCVTYQAEFENYKVQYAKHSRKAVKDITDEEIEELKSDFSEPYIKENEEWNSQFIYLMDVLKNLSNTESDNAYFFSDSNASENQNSGPNTVELHSEKDIPDERDTEVKFKKYFSFNEQNYVQDEISNNNITLVKKPLHNPKIIGSSNQQASTEIKPQNQIINSNQTNSFSSNAKIVQNLPQFPNQNMNNPINYIPKLNQPVSKN